MCISEAGPENMTMVSGNPLTYLTRIMEGSASGLEEKAVLFAKIFKKLREANPEHNFQLFPFSYDNLGHLKSVLAVSDLGKT